MREVTWGQNLVGMFGAPIYNYKPAGNLGNWSLLNNAGPIGYILPKANLLDVQNSVKYTADNFC